MRHARQMLLVSAAALATAGIAGCGSSSDKGTDAPKGSAPAETSPVAKSTPSAPAAASGTQKVAIKDFDYSPRSLTVAKGTKVVWKNGDQTNHTVTFTKTVKKDLGNQPPGASKSYTFAKAGTYTYICDYHPNMHGTVVVR